MACLWLCWLAFPVFSMQVLSNELHEDYFHDTHLPLRRRLQQLAMQAAAIQKQPGVQDCRHGNGAWEDCCNEVLQPHQLQWLLHGWAVSKACMPAHQTTQQPQQQLQQQPQQQECEDPQGEAQAEMVQQLMQAGAAAVLCHVGCGGSLLDRRVSTHFCGLHTGNALHASRLHIPCTCCGCTRPCKCRGT